MTYHTATAARSEALANEYADHAVPILAALAEIARLVERASVAGFEFRTGSDLLSEDAAQFADKWQGPMADYARCNGEY